MAAGDSYTSYTTKRFNSVADPDPESSAFLTPGP
jgi:hypothetical protein